MGRRWWWVGESDWWGIGGGLTRVGGRTSRVVVGRLVGRQGLVRGQQEWSWVGKSGGGSTRVAARVLVSERERGGI